MRFWASMTLLAAAVAAASAQSSTANRFDILQCYQNDPSTWMPNTMDNLIALIEKFETKSSYTNIDEVAEMLLTRYRKDGIVYRPGTGASDWTVDETSKAEKKQELIELILRPSTQPPVDTFDIREECALHRMLSHSIDDYPIAGIDEAWDTALPSASSRSKRSIFTSGNSSPSVPSSPMADAVRAASLYDAALHPLERGVIETPYGPIAGGTLLAGIMSINNNPGYSIQSVLGSDSDYMPSEMKTRTLIPVYAATLAGDLGELALWSRHSTRVGTPAVGPAGRFHNCTTCSQQFSLKSNSIPSLLSRAEVFAGLDGMILAAAYSSNGASGSNSLKLSQLLRLYYSEKGVPGMSNFKACNRLNLYNSVADKTLLTQQALSFMYAYTKDFADQKYFIEQNQNSYQTIEQSFSTPLTQAVQAMDSFISSYGYDDEGASRCYLSSGGNGWNTGSQSQVPPSEGSADLVAIYAEEGTTDYMQKERQMISDVARRLGVSTSRSRLGVLRAKDATWIQPLQNISNIADWGCNFTTSTLYQGGSSSRGDIFTVVLAELTKFYDQQYNEAFQDMKTSSGRSQVVVWQVPAAMPGDLTTNKRAIRNFRLRFPDVSIIYVGRNEAPYQELFDDQDDFISYSNKNMRTVTDETVNRIHMSPRPFMYPACDPNNSTIASNYNENSHTYDGAVSPNMTTYIRIPPQNFHYAEELTLRVQGKVRACFSRTNRLALEEYSIENLDSQRDPLPDDAIQCTGGPNDDLEEVTYKWLCDRYVKTCSPVYISVSGLDSTVRATCNSDTDPECEYPNQIQYTLSHKGMICGASCTAPALLLLLLPALLQYLLH